MKTTKTDRSTLVVAIKDETPDDGYIVKNEVVLDLISDIDELQESVKLIDTDRHTIKQQCVRMGKEIFEWRAENAKLNEAHEVMFKALKEIEEYGSMKCGSSGKGFERWSIPEVTLSQVKQIMGEE